VIAGVTVDQHAVTGRESEATQPNPRVTIGAVVAKESTMPLADLDRAAIDHVLAVRTDLGQNHLSCVTRAHEI